MLHDTIVQPHLWAGVLIWQVLKATVIFAAGYFVVVISRRASAAQHDLILRLVVTAAVGLPVLSLFVPQWEFAFGNTIARVWQTGTVTYDISGAAIAPAAKPGFFASWPIWVLLVWATGVAFVMLHLAAGLAATIRIVRGGRPVTAAKMTGMVDTFRRRFHISRPVRLAFSSRVTTPFTWGILRPIIILPEHSDRWHRRELRFVLLHELAHVRRFDVLWYILASLTAAMYWMNPLVWIVRKRLIIESEKTCDDYVICAGSDGMAYAKHLLEVLRMLRPGRSVGPLGVGMARRSHMEGRLMSILSDRQRSTTLRRSLVIWITALTLLMVLPLAGLTLSAAEQDKNEKAVDTSDEKFPAPDEFIPVGSIPELTYQQAPEYPKEARKEGVEGVVWVKALVDKEGKVRKAMVDKSSGHQLLDDAALKAAYLNEYNPAMQKDKPVAVWVTYKISFELDGKKKDSTGG